MNGVDWRLEVHATLPSTSDEVKLRAEAGAEAGLAVLARRQTRGRGSRGRAWVEPPTGNLALSVLLRPARSQESREQAVFRAALALIEALDRFAGSAALMLKWPNDVLLDGRKLAGILVESAASGDRLAWLVIGFGANLAERPVLADPETRTACLAEGGAVVVSPETVADQLLGRLDHWMATDFTEVRRAWLGRAHPLGSMLVVDGEPGRFAGLSASGALLFEGAAGLRAVTTGAVFAPVLEAAARHPT